MKRVMLWSLLIVVAVVAYVLWLLPSANLAAPTATYIDLHVHAGCVGEGGSGCYLAPILRDGYKYPFYIRAFGTTPEELETEGDIVVLRKLNKKIADSVWIDKAVVLAMDGVIDDTGKLDLHRTQIYVPNAYLELELPNFPHLLYGTSINPYRSDALQRLETAKRHGAVLVKWIPGIMEIDPADPSIIPFYQKMVELELPLLVHVGQERSFAYSHDELGDPLRLELPLQQGVTVIAAHIATTGENEGVANFERILPLFKQYPTLYADISSLTQINKLGYLVRALDEQGLSARLVYGSDWPLQFFPLVSPWYQIRHVSPARLKAIAALDNQWDRDVEIKRALGVPAHVFGRTAVLLKQ